VTYSETGRQLVHVAAVLAAGALRYLTWPQAAGMALAACVFNIILLPRVAPQILRASDRGGWSGVHFYPLAVLALILAFRTRLDLVAAAWAIMAAGDGAATLVGTRWPAKRLPWNAEKTWTGLAAFIVAGVPAAIVAWSWVAPSVGEQPDRAFPMWTIVVVATIAAALVETIPIRLDDNLSVPATAGAVFALALQVEPQALAASWPLIARRLPTAIVINLVLAAAAVLARSITLTGAVVGTLIGVAIYAGAGGNGFVLLAASFALAVTSSQIGRARKIALGIGEARGGRRGAGNALANCLVGAVGAGLIVAQHDDRIGALMLITGLTAGASDTVASEIGKAFGGRPRSVPTFRAVPPGTPGGVTVVGTIAGIVAAAGMALLALALGVPGVEAGMIGCIVVGATAGAFAESALASGFEARGVVNNDVLNFLNTSVASAVAIVAYRLL
jgi:uncharacterized protein (TIGR00297 family)